jgi:hypothetical protein
VDRGHLIDVDSGRNVGSHTLMIKDLDKFEVAAIIVAAIGVIGGGVALFVLASHV